LISVSFTSATHGTIVGSKGTVYRTTNGGSSWSRRFTATENRLLGSSFPDANTGIVVGELGTILRTTNGGTNWVTLPGGTLNRLNAVSFSDAMTGTIVGENGFVLRTTDGGATWNNQSLSSLATLTGISFTNAAVGSIVGLFGQVHRTTDGGTTWRLMTSGSRLPLYSVGFSDQSNGIAVGYGGSILRTSNGGGTWTTVPSGRDTYLRSVAYSNATTATIAGWSNSILRTTDAGLTWIDQSFPNDTRRTFFFSTVSYSPYNSQLGFAVGKLDTAVSPISAESRAMVYRTTNGGVTWTRGRFNLEGWPQVWLHAVSFIDSHITIVGGNNTTKPGGTFFISYDGGSIWNIVAGTNWELSAVSFNKAKTGLAVGDHGSVWKSTDGGTEWSVRPSGVSVPLRAVRLFDQNLALAVGDSLTIIKSSDAGETWTTMSSGMDVPLHGMGFWNTLQGAIVGDGGLILSTSPVTTGVDGGRSDGAGLPSTHTLLQNYPNPFNPRTAVSYQLSAVSFVNLRVFDVLGREVATLEEGVRSAGTHRVVWNAAGFPSGIYICRLKVIQAGGNAVLTRKMLLAK
jgi:photosystem II stability/assembly factor-like uncharacterized protein